LQCRLEILTRPNFTTGISVLLYNNSTVNISDLSGYVLVYTPPAYVTVTAGSGMIDGTMFSGHYIQQDPGSPEPFESGSKSKFNITIGSLAVGAWFRWSWAIRFNQNMTYRASAAITIKAAFTGGGLTAGDIRRPTLRPPLELL